jgi:hypothetical protein
VSFNGSGVFQINTAGQPVVSGTVISSTAFNALTADLATGLSTCVTKDGQTTPTANIPMGNYKFTGLGAGTDAGDSANLGQVQSTVVKLIGSVSGTDTITGSLTPALTAYAAGQMFYFVAAGDNTGAVTLNINSLGAKNVTKNGTTALSAAEIKSGQTVAVIYDGTRFQMVNPVVVGLTGITTATTTALGVGAGDSVTSGSNNTAIGYNAGTAITTGVSSTVVGYESGTSLVGANFNTLVGYQSGYSNVSSSSLTALGYLAGRNTLGNFNTALGRSALQAAASASGGQNTAVGAFALEIDNAGENNVAVGYQALKANTSGNENTAVGYSAGDLVTTGTENTFVGKFAGIDITTGSYNTGVGANALANSFLNHSNCSGLGYGTTVTGNDQVQLGNSSTTTYVYGTVQNRSDLRDKADVQDTDLGLEFIMGLRPRKYRWDMREDYKVPRPPQNATEDEIAAWKEANKLSNLTHDGSQTRTRYHQGLIAQEVKATMDAMGVDFGGYQDHKINGGEDVLSIGYDEMIAPLVKAIQELKAEFDAYKATHP